MNGNGVGDFVDSVAAVKKIVFEEQRFGMAELVAAVKADFRGYEASGASWRRTRPSGATTTTKPMP